MLKAELEQLILETKRRQRRKTNLAEFDEALKEMMAVDISLPVMLDWLSRNGATTTLPALRRYIRRVFGENHYDDFVNRNGWQRTKDVSERSAASAVGKIGKAKVFDASDVKRSSNVDAVKAAIHSSIDTSEFD